MQIPFQTLAQDSVLQIRDAMRRVTRMHEAAEAPQALPSRFSSGLVDPPKPDTVAWEDTEIDVRRVVL
ncbi:MAG TPA: hypothetical protein VIN03_16170 [Roseateles sp.]